MRKYKIILRADAGPGIGMGHFTRTLALAEILNNEFECIFATRKPNSYQLEEMKCICQKSISLSGNNNHYNEFLNHLTGQEIVVLDNYYYDTSYQKHIKDLGCKLVCIDDIHDKHYVADAVINHAEGLKAEEFSVEKYTRLYLGYNYAMLRKAFLSFSEYKKKTIDLMICIGGADPADISKLIVDLVKTELPDINFAVLLGNAYKGRLLQYRIPGLLIINGAGSDKVAELMQKSVLGIFPASTIAIEAIATRLPFLVGYFVDNQYKIYNGIVENELAVPIDDLSKIDKKQIIQNIKKILYSESIRKRISKNQQNILDKKSPERLLKIFKTLKC